MRKMIAGVLVAVVLAMGAGAPKGAAMKPAAAATQPVVDPFAAINAMPQNLWPLPKDAAAIKTQLRNQWMADNLGGHSFGPSEIAGIIQDVRLVDVEKKKQIQVMFFSTSMILGNNRKIAVTAIFPEQPIQESLTWKVGMKITASGMVKYPSQIDVYSTPQMSINLADSEMISVEDAVIDGPATRPAIKPHPIAITLNRLPKELWPAKDEPGLRVTQRQDWVKKNVAVTGTWTFEGTITAISETQNPRGRGGSSTRRGATSSTEPHVSIALTSPAGDVWDTARTFEVSATLSGVTPETAAKWSKGMHVTISGTGAANEFDLKETRGTIRVQIKDAMIRVPPAIMPKP